tara:strand:+ start:2971 stop:3123 length:153 start_codon:yes stop_codon:yes gene_type:complete
MFVKALAARLELLLYKFIPKPLPKRCSIPLKKKIKSLFVNGFMQGSTWIY